MAQLKMEKEKQYYLAQQNWCVRNGFLFSSAAPKLLTIGSRSTNEPLSFFL
jgi:hypothetical protein